MKLPVTMFCMYSSDDALACFVYKYYRVCTTCNQKEYATVIYRWKMSW